MATAQVYHAVGKRKTAVARIYLRKGNGKIQVNERTFENYFPENFRDMVHEPFSVLNLKDKYDVNVNVFGGGVSAQAWACRHGIAKALTLVDVENRSPLKKELLLRRDDRVVERKKYGHKKARKSFQFSKR